ncbi:MAG TPA: restriction endonuclease subunit S, partial [Methylophilaceae bacterium]|nr:restriction endonuclease subunit S [Methylophilaceae bacterium]
AALLEADRLEQDAARDFLHGLGLAAPDEAKRRKAFAVRWSDCERWGMEWNQQRISGTSPDVGKFPTVALGEAIDLVQYGTSEKANQDGNGLPVLRMNNVKAGLLDVSDLKHINLPPKVAQGLLLKDGDILVIRTNGSRDLVGTCAVFHEVGEYVFASYLIRLCVNASKLNPDFAAFFLNSALGRSQVNAVSRQIMQNNINSEELRGLRLPLPPLETQQTLVNAITAARQQTAAKRAEAGSLKTRAAAEIEAAILGESSLNNRRGRLPDDFRFDRDEANTR